MRLRYTLRAHSDIADIHNYIAQHNPRAATAVVRRIRSTCLLLASYPGIGRPTNIPDVRVLPIGRYPYLVYHAVGATDLVIVHVRHGARAAPQSDEF
jgi:plasmid stabilization system protein ParE